MSDHATYTEAKKKTQKFTFFYILWLKNPNFQIFFFKKAQIVKTYIIILFFNSFTIEMTDHTAYAEV